MAKMVAYEVAFIALKDGMVQVSPGQVHDSGSKLVKASPASFGTLDEWAARHATVEHAAAPLATVTVAKKPAAKKAAK